MWVAVQKQNKKKYENRTFSHCQPDQADGRRSLVGKMVGSHGRSVRSLVDGTEEHRTSRLGGPSIVGHDDTVGRPTLPHRGVPGRRTSPGPTNNPPLRVVILIKMLQAWVAPSPAREQAGVFPRLIRAGRRSGSPASP